MKRTRSLSLLITVLAIILSACSPSPTLDDIAEKPANTAAPQTTISPTSPSSQDSPTPIPLSQGETIIVSSAADSGPGTMRQALLDAQDGDTITFDPATFPPDDPTVIKLDSALPGLTQSNLLLSGKGAGAIIDGSSLPDTEFKSGIEIINAANVTVEGLVVSGFPGAGIVLAQTANSLVQENVLYDNQLGIGTWDPGATGNLILSNEIFACNIGISVSHGAHDITLESNTIYDNVEFGLTITHEGSSARVSQNQIYDNGDEGIYLNNGWRGIYIEGPQDPPPVPLVTDFDLESGEMSGVACPLCTVEIFSTETAQGQSFAGSTIADEAGAFSLSGLSFEHDSLTATATDDSMTSAFSEPTTGTQQVYHLQRDNPNPKGQFVGARPEDGFNGLGEMYGLAASVFEATPEQFVNQAMDVGLTWERVSLDEFDFHEDWMAQTGRAPWSIYEISAKQRSAFELLKEKGFVVMYTLLFWDEQIEPQLDDPGYTRFDDQAEIDRFIEYTTFLIENLGEYIDWYEIWNEPETDDPGQYIPSENYIAVVEQLLPVIRQLDPGAKVAVGATPDYEIVFDLIESDLISEVDGLSWHPFYGNAPGLDLEGWPNGYWESYPSLLEEIKLKARANGFEGEFIAEEMNWRTPLNAPPLGYAGHDPIPAAKYLGRAIVFHRGMGAWSGLAENYPVYPKGQMVRNLADLMGDAEATQREASLPASEMDTAMYTFQATDKEMVAFWEEGAATNLLAPDSVDSISTITLTLATEIEGDVQVVIVDPLLGVQQEAVVIREGQRLILSDLVIKDYPLLVLVTYR